MSVNRKLIEESNVSTVDPECTRSGKKETVYEFLQDTNAGGCQCLIISRYLPFFSTRFWTSWRIMTTQLLSIDSTENIAETRRKYPAIVTPTLLSGIHLQRICRDDNSKVIICSNLHFSLHISLY